MAAPGPPGDRLRAATLNVWGSGPHWPERRDHLIRGFGRLRADLVTLQETVHRPGRAGAVDQAREILGAGYHLVRSEAREPDGRGITTASRWPVGEVVELDLHVTARTHAFACTALLVEIHVPAPIGRVWSVHHFPDYQLDHEHERTLQARVVALAVEEKLRSRPGHVVLSGDLDAEPAADSLRFLRGLHVVGGLSVCYRDAWTAAHGNDSGRETFVPENPYCADWDWPFRQIDHLLVRCGEHGGPTLRVLECSRTFDQAHTVAGDHYGLFADLAPPPEGELQAG
ncbi:endonuclease/exonuclease/phosphatase family protein [Actinoplanes sp. M2I2]|uniref:endonuclease/exonuclease/phosphatase family protein n=1 Tax=Actinoplanes sp. M2I2 TaxID=1734444 RepID=UPI002020834C|nr:endonuclease/exonuclease/phosphatase family protein [Actinoplanes sp. M2I2]